MTLGTSAYEALANGAVDFTLEVATWEGVKAELERQEAAQLPLRRLRRARPAHHLHRLQRCLSPGDPTPRRAFLAATQRGYAYAVDIRSEAGES